MSKAVSPAILEIASEDLRDFKILTHMPVRDGKYLIPKKKQLFYW